MKMYINIFLLFFVLTLKASFASIGIQTKYGDFIIHGGRSKMSMTTEFIEQKNVPVNELEDILIAYINEGTNSLQKYEYSQRFALGVLVDISKSEKVQNYVDSILKSKKTDLYYSAYNAFLKIKPYSVSSFENIENYIKINDENSNSRRSIFYVDFSHEIDANETLSVDIKFNMVKLMLKYLTYDLHNWQYLDQVLCDKIPSYRHSLQRKNMIEYVDSKKENLADWERTELIRVNGEFNKAIQESPIIELTDEILMKEIKVFKTKKKFIKVYM
ncbi:MAG: hypothetical protein II332_01180 [Kiritimatiellae bacterium]|nr:hypothetical protein [Kiritimatiellia bacterium]